MDCLGEWELRNAAFCNTEPYLRFYNDLRTSKTHNTFINFHEYIKAYCLAIKHDNASSQHSIFSVASVASRLIAYFMVCL